MKLVVIILNISYLLGLMWLVMCDIVFDFSFDMDKYSDEWANKYEETYIFYNSLHKKSAAENTLIVTYFAFTSLSTVGFGDYNPRSDIERFVCAFILLFGVAIFSYIMGNFISILDQFKDFNKDLDDGDGLAKFFGVMSHFNGGKPVELTLKRQIEDYFDYKWKFDKNIAFSNDADRACFE